MNASAFVHRAAIAALILISSLSPRSAIQAAEPAWPPFLPRSLDSASEKAVEKIWNKRTFERRLNPNPVDVPIDLYAALISTPEVVAAAANRLGLTSSTVTVVDDRTYEWRTVEGSRALYRILLSEPRHQVTLFQGHLIMYGLTVHGSMLGNLDLSNDSTGVHQDLSVYVQVDRSIMAWLTKLFVALIPGKIDAEVSHGFEFTGAVARWAWRDREGFCRWRQTSGFAPERTDRITELVGCATVVH